MTATVEARCTQCGSTRFGDPTENTNTDTYDVPVEQLRHGSGREHGTETLLCRGCGELTLHNRAGRSVPQAND